MRSCELSRQQRGGHRSRAVCFPTRRRHLVSVNAARRSRRAASVSSLAASCRRRAGGGCAYAQCVTAASSKVSAVPASTSNNVRASCCGGGVCCRNGGASFTVSSTTSSAMVKGRLAGVGASILDTSDGLGPPAGPEGRENAPRKLLGAEGRIAASGPSGERLRRTQAPAAFFYC